MYISFQQIFLVKSKTLKCQSINIIKNIKSQVLGVVLYYTNKERKCCIRRYQSTVFWVYPWTAFLLPLPVLPFQSNFLVSPSPSLSNSLLSTQTVVIYGFIKLTEATVLSCMCKTPFPSLTQLQPNQSFPETIK